jgi:hypothetical protein
MECHDIQENCKGIYESSEAALTILLVIEGLPAYVG